MKNDKSELFMIIKLINLIFYINPKFILIFKQNVSDFTLMQSRCLNQNFLHEGKQEE